MKFALNYSPEAAGLIQAGRLEIDFFKTPPWPDMIRAASRHRPVAIHFELQAGAGHADADWQAVDRYLQLTSTKFVNLHLDAKQKHFSAGFHRLAAASRIDRVIDRLVADVQPAVDYFGAERVIVENAPYRGPNTSKKLAETVLPQVISAVVQATGCGLLLDISHARISAHSLAMNPEKYMADLPIGSLRELHITGIHTLPDGYLQDHLSMLPEDWEWLEWVVANIRTGDWPEPELLAFEYGGTGPFFAENSDPAVLVEQVPRLVAQAHRASRPV